MSLRDATQFGHRDLSSYYHTRNGHDFTALGAHLSEQHDVLTEDPEESRSTIELY